MPTVFKKPILIYNPVAGQTNPQNLRKAFQHVCEQYGWDSLLHETKKDEDLLSIVQHAIQQNCDLIIAAGGDGTVSEVASTLVNHDLPLAIIPSGTGNLLARQLHLPLNHQKAFAYITNQPDSLYLDSMQIDAHHYILNVSIGLTSTMIEQTTREEKRKFGMLAYVWNGIRVFIGFQPHRFHINIDSVHITTRASEVFITHTVLLKGDPVFKELFNWTEEGNLGVFIIKARTLWSYFQLLFDFIARKAHRTHNLTYYPLQKTFNISTKKTISVQADGEAIGNTPMQMKVLPKAVRVLIPSKSANPSLLDAFVQRTG
ncbi:MAG: diacylglycerol kinase family lipid kinase [Anaerolineaceae bacterium]|nr:diacylglycerol kinase family lipid kinase [Anaerolineaceae bacterium]